MDRAITEEELDGILDRERVFASSTAQWGDSSATVNREWGRRGDGNDGAGWGERKEGRTGPVLPLPREGEMYDIVDELDASGLNAMA